MHILVTENHNKIDNEHCLMLLHEWSIEVYGEDISPILYISTAMDTVVVMPGAIYIYCPLVK